MSQPNILRIAHDLPRPVLELATRLEEHGIRAFSHGEGLLDDLREASGTAAANVTVGRKTGIGRTRSLLCVASPEKALRALPRAVVTSEHAIRISQATAVGPVDLIFTGARNPEPALLDFGLGPLCFGFRPADASWCDPANQLEAFSAGRLELAKSDPNPFIVAPRRYWIAARLIAERALEAAPSLLSAARDALPEILPRLPQAAPARREIQRILVAPDPAPGLAFLRESGVTAACVPGATAAHAERIGDLPPLPSVRWAAWLRGGTTARALVRFRVPHALARRIERIQASHPIDRSVDGGRDLGVRKLLQRHDEEEIDALFAWRRLEFAALSRNRPNEAIEGDARLHAIEGQIQEAQAAEARTDQVRSLALDGRAVMATLGAGPGRHVGQALAHLARFVADRPDANERDALESELRKWRAKQPNGFD